VGFAFERASPMVACFPQSLRYRAPVNWSDRARVTCRQSGEAKSAVP